MSSTITKNGLETAISNLRYRNPKLPKTRLIEAIRSFYTAEDALETISRIDADALIRMIWEPDDNPELIKSRRKNLNSVKAIVNNDLIRLFQEDKNPEGIIIGPANTFVMSDAAKERLLSSFADSAKAQGNLPLERVAEVLNVISQFISEMEQRSDGNPKDEVKKILDLIKGMAEKAGLDGESDADVEEIKADDFEEVDEGEIEEIDADEIEEVEEITDDDLEILEDTELEEIDEDVDLEEVDADEIEEIEDTDQIDADEVEEIDDEDVEEIETDDFEEFDEDEIEEIDTDEIEEVEENADNDPEILEDTEVEEIDEDVDLEEVDADEMEEIDDTDIEEINEDDLEEIDEDQLRLPRDNLKQNDFQTDENLLAEQFDGFLGSMERYYNQYLLVPGGNYRIGNQSHSDIDLPEQQISLPDFYIGKYPISNALFEVFVERTGYKTTAEKRGYGWVYSGRFRKHENLKTGVRSSEWKATYSREKVSGAYWYQPTGPGSTLHGKRNHPVVQVSVQDAVHFSAWVGKRLPAEFEWEAAARTSEGYPYPWGNEWMENACNYERSAISDTTPVDRYPQGENSLRIADTLCNVLEWTSDQVKPVSGKIVGKIYNIAKGGSWISDRTIQLSNRFRFESGFTANILGFRCLAD
ncbi:MAG: SUMF1/EgtB/PvdO family nonheme iron enzyme [Pseudomonadota bacterium]